METNGPRRGSLWGISLFGNRALIVGGPRGSRRVRLGPGEETVQVPSKVPPRGRAADGSAPMSRSSTSRFKPPSRPPLHVQRLQKEARTPASSTLAGRIAGRRRPASRPRSGRWSRIASTRCCCVMAIGDRGLNIGVRSVGAPPRAWVSAKRHWRPLPPMEMTEHIGHARRGAGDHLARSARVGVSHATACHGLSPIGLRMFHRQDAAGWPTGAWRSTPQFPRPSRRRPLGRSKMGGIGRSPRPERWCSA